MADREYYDMVLDEDELHWFFDHIVQKPEPAEGYMICLACRGKKLTEEERKYTKVGSRGEMMREELIRTKGGLAQEWNFDIFKQAFYRYNCDKKSLLTSSHVPYPEHAMTVYMVINPSDEMNCIEDLIHEYNTRRRDMTNASRKNSIEGVRDSLVKMPKVVEHLKSCHAHNCPRRIWIDYDFDIKKQLRTESSRKVIYDALHTEGLKLFGKGNFAVIKTSGGFHTLVKKECLKFKPSDFIDNVTAILSEKELPTILVAKEDFGPDSVSIVVHYKDSDGNTVLNNNDILKVTAVAKSLISKQDQLVGGEDRLTLVLDKVKSDIFLASLARIVTPYDEFVINPTKSSKQDAEHPWRVKSPMIPTPGCRQYDDYPVVVNKGDFDD